MNDDSAPPIDPSIYAPPKAEDSPPSVGAVRGRPAVFFAVSPLKLVVMSIATLGIYELFWFFANWQRMKRRGQRNISPFWRTFFACFTCYSLFRSVKEAAVSANVKTSISPGVLAVGWVITTFMWRLPDPAWLIAYGAVFFLVPVQKVVNDVNHALYPDHDPNTRFTGWNIAGIVVGGLLLGLILFGTLMPA